MRQNSSVGTVLYFVLSTAFHGGMAYALVSVAQMQMGSEGHGETVEFVTTEFVATESTPNVPAPTPEPLAKEMVEEKAPAPKPVKKSQATAKPKPVTELPQKVFIQEEPTNEESVAVVSQPIVESPAQETVEESLPLVEDAPVIAAEETLPENDSSAAPTDEALTTIASDETLETLTEETPPETAEPEVVVVPIDEPTPESQPAEESSADRQELKEESQQEPQASPGFDSPTSDAPTEARGRGAEGTNLRSYTELRQVPGNKPPKYPTLARRQNHQGQVQLSYYVKKDGKISDLKVIKSSGYPTLDREAVRAVSLFQYQAGQEGWTMHPVDFQLQGPVKKTPSRLRTSSRDPKNF